MAVDWSEFVTLVQQHQRFLLVSHIRPDCDALGSELGMDAVLRALGKDVLIVNGQATPSNLAFLDPDHRLLAIGEDIQPERLADRQVIIILDTSAWAQLGPMADIIRQSSAKKLVVDHHLGEDALEAELFKDTTAEATGRLVVEAADALGVALTEEIAQPVFAAVATDTGWYRFPSVSGRTYRLAARLTEAGASPAKIYSALYEQETIARVRLRGIILSRVRAELDGRLVHTFVRLRDFEQTGAEPQDTEDAINLTLAIAGTQFAFILVEQTTGGFKLSFRSRCDVDCSQVAARFGGGGHKAAAGAFIDAPFEEAQRQVLQYVRDQLAASLDAH